MRLKSASSGKQLPEPSVLFEELRGGSYAAPMLTRLENGSAEANASSGSNPCVRRSGNDIDLETPMFPVVRTELKEQVTLLHWQMSTG